MKTTLAAPELAIKGTTVYGRNAAAWLTGKRRTLNEGGTSSSKTYSIIQLIILIAKSSIKPLILSIVSESLPHLKRGAIRDFKEIMGNMYDPRAYNKSDFVYTFPNGSVIEFFGIDDPRKGRGGRRDILFINECNNISYDSYMELDMRTRMFTMLDWNPVAEFWVHDKDLFNHPENVYIHSTYMDAKHVLPEAVVERIESLKDEDENWWNVYGLGILGQLENLIWPHWQKCMDLPAKYRSWAYGLDHGYAHPLALTKVYFTDTGTYWDEVIHERGLTNADLIERMTHLERADVYADPARPDNNEELKRAGWNVIAANNDVQIGLDVVKRSPLFITERSTNLIREVRGYQRKVEKATGRVLEAPLKINDDGMDSGRYGTLGQVERFGFATADPHANKARWKRIRIGY